MSFYPEHFSLLEERNRRKAYRLGAGLQDAVVSLRDASQKRFDVQGLRSEVRNRIKNPKSKEDLASAAASLPRIEQELAAMDARLDRAQSLREGFVCVEEAAVWLGRRWVDQIHGVDFALRDYPFRLKTIPTDFNRAVQAVRNKLGQAAAEHDHIDHAPVPLNVLIELMEAEVDQIAETGAPKLKTTYMPEFSANPQMRRSGVAFDLKQHVERSPVDFAVWLNSDGLKQRLGQIIAQSDFIGAMSDQERATAFNELAARKLELEREEEALISAAEERNIFIPRRRDVDPRALLEVSGV